MQDIVGCGVVGIGVVVSFDVGIVVGFDVVVESCCVEQIRTIIQHADEPLQLDYYWKRFKKHENKTKKNPLQNMCQNQIYNW